MKCQDWEPAAAAAAAAAAVSPHRVCCVTAATWSSGAQPPARGRCVHFVNRVDILFSKMLNRSEDQQA